MGNADLVTATFFKFIFASLNPSQRLKGEFWNFILTLNMLLRSKYFILPLSKKMFWSSLCKFSLVRICLTFCFEKSAHNPAVTSVKETKEVLLKPRCCFFCFVLLLAWKKNRQKQYRKEVFLLVNKKLNYSHFSKGLVCRGRWVFSALQHTFTCCIIPPPDGSPPLRTTFKH